jgi:uncharacterized protein (TIGR03435 family)
MDTRHPSFEANPQLNRPTRMLPVVEVRRVVYALSIAYVLLSSLAPLCGAQALAAGAPGFVVATIKSSDPNRPDNKSSIGLSPGGSFSARSMSLKQLVEFVQDFGYIDVDQRIAGGPKWLGSAKFDIEAKCDEATARAFGTMPARQRIRTEQDMIQAMLADRFKLRTHHETRRLPVYILVQAKGGSKMTPSATAADEKLGGTDGSPGNWKGNGVTMAELAGDLSSLPEIGGRIVIDETGFKGRFDFTLKWPPDSTMGAAPPGPDSGTQSDSSAPSLLTALREQLGLKLEIRKEPVDVIVIDSAELPTPN